MKVDTITYLVRFSIGWSCDGARGDQALAQRNLLFGIILALCCNVSSALEVITGRVTVLEPTYLPGVVTFAMDTGTPLCKAGSWLIWRKADVSNNKAVYALLMTALATGKRIRFHVNEKDPECVGQYVHLLAE